MRRPFEGLSRRRFLLASGAAGLALTAGIARAEPYDEGPDWIANHESTRLVGPDGKAIAWVPAWTRMRVVRGLPKGWLEVWVPRLGLVGRVTISSIGPVPAPSPDELVAEQAEPAGPAVIDNVGLPGRVVRGANLRLWPNPAPDTLLRSLGHNAPLRVIASVEGDDDNTWYQVDWIDPVSYETAGHGYVLDSSVRLPRLPYLVTAADRTAPEGSRWFEVDLREPALITAFEEGGPIWSTLTLKGTISRATPTGMHEIVRRVANETMTSERVYPPIPRNAPGGYYLTGVLWTQYFTLDGASIHYNYWSSNWGYAGSHGCLGIAYNEAKWAWGFADVGTPVRIFV